MENKESDPPAKLASLAQRALANIGIQNLEQLAKFSEAEIKELHGIGPNTLVQLRAALKANGLSFREPKKVQGGVMDKTIRTNFGVWKD